MPRTRSGSVSGATSGEDQAARDPDAGQEDAAGADNDALRELLAEVRQTAHKLSNAFASIQCQWDLLFELHRGRPTRQQLNTLRDEISEAAGLVRDLSRVRADVQQGRAAALRGSSPHVPPRKG